MVRADGDALVMHVGERPYVVTQAGTLDLSTHGLNLGAMTGMLQQLLPAEQQSSLEEFGAVEHTLPALGDDRFTMVAARGGDDIWIEIRRRRPSESARAGAAVAAVAEPTAVAAHAPPSADAREPEPAAEPAEIPEEPAVAAAKEIPVPEMITPVPEMFAASPEIDPAALLDQLIPVDDPDVEMPYDFVAAVESAYARDDSGVEAVEPVSARDYSDALKEDLADIAFADSERDDVFVIETPMAAAANAEPFKERLVAEAPAASVEPAPVPDEAPLNTALAFGRDPGSSVVLPMTRSTRGDGPARRVPPSRTSTVERLLRIAFARGASSLFLTSDSRPCIRVEGDIRLLDGEAVLSRADVEAAIMEIVPQEAQESIGSGQATEWIAQLPGLGGVRCTSSMDHRGPGVVFTMIATRAATAEQLGLPREIQALATEAEGLVLVAGSRGSGKSTLMSALVDLVNHQRAEYVITLERQIRLVHDNHTALVSQREIRGGAEDVVAAARAALRENPDVLVVDDLSSTQMVPLLLEAAAGGLLVFVSITAPSTSDALERLLDLAPAGSRTSVQAAMAETFRGAVSQVLLKKSGGGRVVAREIMLATAAVTRLIGDGQLAQLPLALESGRRHGMVPLTDVLLGLVQGGVVDVREAFRKTHDRDRLLAGLKREGIDTSAVERLA